MSGSEPKYGYEVDLGDQVPGNKPGKTLQPQWLQLDKTRDNTPDTAPDKGYLWRHPRVSRMDQRSWPALLITPMPTPMPTPMSTQSAHDYSIVVPVLNESGNVLPLIEEIVATMDELDGAPSYEIIYVDDGSSDSTAAELESAATSHSVLRVLRHKKPCGQSQALLTGVSEASGEWIITLDGDGQNDPADIPKLVEQRNKSVLAEPKYAETFLYIGHRQLRHDSLPRRYQSWLANDIRGWLLGDHTPDSGCGLKLFQRDLFLALPRFDALHRFLPALIIRAGGRAVSVAVSHRPRKHGYSKYGFWRRLGLGVIDLIGVIWLIARHTRPELTK